MGRNNDDFASNRSTRLSEDATCQQGNCAEPATKFSWSDGNFCSDCWDESTMNRRLPLDSD